MVPATSTTSHHPMLLIILYLFYNYHILYLYHIYIHYVTQLDPDLLLLSFYEVFMPSIAYVYKMLTIFIFRQYFSWTCWADHQLTKINTLVHILYFDYIWICLYCQYFNYNYYLLYTNIYTKYEWYRVSKIRRFLGTLEY